MYFGNFLDRFYKSPNNEWFLVKPNFEGVEKYIAVFTVASMCCSCDRFELEKPEWTKSKEFIMEEPWFTNNTKGPLRFFYLVESPQAFRCRNMFVSNKVLNRC